MNIKILACLFLVSATFSCSSNPKDSFKYGVKYNPVRKKFRVPVIKRNMTIFPGAADGTWTIYSVDERKMSSSAYHKSKTIRLIIDNKVKNEEDIYRNTINGKTVQLNVETTYNGKSRSLTIWGNVGALDSNMGEWIQFPDSVGIDSVLRSWGLSRFDEY